MSLNAYLSFFPNGRILPFNIPNFLSRFVNVVNVLGNTAVDLAVDISGLANAIQEKAMADLDQKLYQEASHAFKAQTILQPDNPIAFYNVATAEALIGNITEALLYLNKAIDLGYSDLHHILQDADFINISSIPGFQLAINRLRDIINPPVADSYKPESVPNQAPEPINPEPVKIPQPVKISESVNPVNIPQSEPVKIPDPLVDDWYVPEPVVETPPVIPQNFAYTAELEVLHDIGYLNDEIVIPILEKNLGDIQNTVFELLDM